MKNIMINEVENGFIVTEDHDNVYPDKRWAFETKESLAEFILNYYAAKNDTQKECMQIRGIL